MAGNLRVGQEGEVTRLGAHPGLDQAGFCFVLFFIILAYST